MKNILTGLLFAIFTLSTYASNANIAQLTVRDSNTSFGICSKSLQNCTIQISQNGCLSSNGSITITNTSTIIAKNIAASSSNSNYTSYVVQVNNCPASLAPGASCTISFYTNSFVAFTVPDVMVKGSNTSSTFFNINATLCTLSYTVTSSAGVNGSINPSGSQTASPGASLTFTATPSVGFVTNQWFLDGIMVQNGGNSYQLNNILANHTVAVTFNSSLKILVAAGGYVNNTSQTKPLLVSSSNNGATWSYKITDNEAGTFPPTYSLPSDTTFLLSSCYEQTCIAGGGYRSSGTNLLTPLIATSNDGSATWSYTYDGNSTLPASFYELPNLNPGAAGASCSSQNDCVVVGNYMDALSNDYALILYSSDKGQHWNSVLDALSLPPGYFDSSALGSVSCSESICVAAGRYSTSSGNIYGLIARSSNYGASWTYALTSNQTPSGYDNVLGFVSVSCSGTLCMAGGAYRTTTSQYPVIAKSSDGGAHWTYVLDRTKSMPPGYVDVGGIQSISCAGINCVAVGGYGNSAGIQYPLIAVTNNGGAQWTYTLYMNNLPANYADGNNNFPLVSCNGVHCVAAGTYVGTDTLHYPGIATSHDSGNTWVYTLDSSKAMPPGFDGSQCKIYGVTCNNNACIVSGYYSTGSIPDGAPLIIQSTDNGQTWTYPVNATTPALPVGFQFGGFATSSAGITTLLPDYLKEFFHS